VEGEYDTLWRHACGDEQVGDAHLRVVLVDPEFAVLPLHMRPNVVDAMVSVPALFKEQKLPTFSVKGLQRAAGLGRGGVTAGALIQHPFDNFVRRVEYIGGL